MRWGRIYIIPNESTLAVPPTCLQGAWHTRSLQSKYAAAAFSASRVRRWHRARTLEARLSRSRLALNLHLPATQTVPATHVGGAPPCAARTWLLRSRRRRSARSSYCTLINNRCVLSACSCVSQNTHRRRASVVRFSAFRLPNPTQTRRREVHGGLWPRLKRGPANTWWHYQMETFSALLAIRAWNSPFPGEFPAQRPVTRRFGVFFDLHPNKRLSKQWWGWWFETPSCPLWRHRNDPNKKGLCS